MRLRCWGPGRRRRDRARQQPHPAGLSWLLRLPSLGGLIRCGIATRDPIACNSRIVTKSKRCSIEIQHSQPRVQLRTRKKKMHTRIKNVIFSCSAVNIIFDSKNRLQSLAIRYRARLIPPDLQFHFSTRVLDERRSMFGAFYILPHEHGRPRNQRFRILGDARRRGCNTSDPFQHATLTSVDAFGFSMTHLIIWCLPTFQESCIILIPPDPASMIS